MRIDGTIVSKRVPLELNGAVVTTTDGRFVLLMRNQPTPAWSYTPKREWPMAFCKYVWSVISQSPSVLAPPRVRGAVKPNAM